MSISNWQHEQLVDPSSFSFPPTSEPFHLCPADTCLLTALLMYRDLPTSSRSPLTVNKSHTGFTALTRPHSSLSSRLPCLPATCASTTYSPKNPIVALSARHILGPSSDPFLQIAKRSFFGINRNRGSQEYGTRWPAESGLSRTRYPYHA